MRGARVDVRVPQRGEKRELAQTVLKNAEHALVLHKTRRSGDLTTRSQALREIQEALDLETAPLRIECYDISHTQGTYQSASMVVFEDGLARKSEYRTFSIRGSDGEGARDDTEAMYEVITRRFRRYLADRAKSGEVELDIESGEITPQAEDGEKKRFAYPPNLVVVDGGPPQVLLPGARSTIWASLTWRCAASRSGSKRCGCRATTTRSSWNAAPKASTCCSACATKPTGSRSRPTADGAARA